jgi:alanine-glyoxylate transaminase/serine-glyoxylate transaminase/serine-pyruvate transaminase
LLNGAALHAGLEAMGLKLHAQQGHRLSSLTTVVIPEGIDDLKVRQQLLDEYNIEIGGGLGPLKSKVWRIGLMGYSSSEENVLLILGALDKLLSRSGHKIDVGAGLKAAIHILKA